MDWFEVVGIEAGSGWQKRHSAFLLKRLGRGQLVIRVDGVKVEQFIIGLPGHLLGSW